MMSSFVSNGFISGQLQPTLVNFLLGHFNNEPGQKLEEDIFIDLVN